MARPRKYCRDGATGREVFGVSLHPEGGFYIINLQTARREYFGKDLDAAKKRYADLTGQPDPKPEAVPSGTKVSGVAKIYLAWYLRERDTDIDELEKQAAYYNDTLDKRLADALARRNKLGLKANAHTKTIRLRPRKTFIDFAPRKVKRRYREHTRYFQSFIQFTGDIDVSQLTAEHFRTYRDFIRSEARRRKVRPTWRNHRFEAVTTAFRRANREADISFPKGLFGVDGWLSILEKTETTGQTDKVVLTAAEFRALIEHADTQWQAILHLSLNCALSNTDISEIRWSNIDFPKRIMFYSRGKTRRTRQTPLAYATINALSNWQKESTAKREEIFTTWQGAAWTANGISDGYRALVETCKGHNKIIRGSFNALRKSSASTAMRALASEVEIEMLLGHCPRRSWIHYVGFAPQFLHDAVKAIEKTYFIPESAALLAEARTKLGPYSR